MSKELEEGSTLMLDFAKIAKIAETCLRHRDLAGAADALRQRRRLAEDEAVLVVEDRADMLHAAEGKGGRKHQVELGEGKGDLEPVAEPAHCGAVGGAGGGGKNRAAPGAE